MMRIASKTGVLAQPVAPLAAAFCAALLLAGCAGSSKPATEQAAVAPAATPAPAMPAEGTMLPSADATTIRFNDHTIPPGGQVIGLATATINGEKANPPGLRRWSIHGEMDGAAWRMGPEDGNFIRVAGAANEDWQFLQVLESWGVICKVEAPVGSQGGSTPCAILRLRPVQPGSMAVAGLALDSHVTCIRSDNPGSGGTIAVDAGAPQEVSSIGCVTGEASDALQQQMLAGRSVTITGTFEPNGTQQTLTIPTYGLKQALTMRQWILDQYKAGNLTLQKQAS
jgi:hypothetical protein